MTNKTLVLPEDRFITTIEVVPPAGPDPEPLLQTLAGLTELPIDGFSVATNPVAKPRMSALALCALIQQRTGLPAILHCTTRDHNRLSLTGQMWGARALGIQTILAATGDFVALVDRDSTTDVRDTDVFGLVAMAREAGMRTGVVFDTHPERNGFERETGRLHRKAAAGAQFIVTQPVYDIESADAILEATEGLSIPVILGILPLRTFRHAVFLHEKVAGIAVSREVRNRMERASDPVAEGVANACEMLAYAREKFAGACVMPPFDHYEILADILA